MHLSPITSYKLPRSPDEKYLAKLNNKINFNA